MNFEIIRPTAIPIITGAKGFKLPKIEFDKIAEAIIVTAAETYSPALRAFCGFLSPFTKNAAIIDAIIPTVATKRPNLTPLSP